MDRREFENRLSSLIVPEGTPVPEIEKQVFPIREAIAEMMPKSLFRYRACDERHIDAFENDKIFAVPADWFNDPYDTLVRYDYDGIKKYVDYVASADWLSQLKEYFALGNDFPKDFKQIFPDEFWNELRTRVLEFSDFKGLEEKLEESKQQLLSLVSTYFPILSVIGKRFSTIACFSEDVQSILMWSHYADSHKGFALEYDFTPTLTKPLPRVALFPVIYSDNRYEASAYLTWALFFVMRIKVIQPDISASIKAALYKSSIWGYEREWRMIDPGPHDVLNPVASVIEYRPVAIYYGKNIDIKNKTRLHKIAVAKGIKEFEMLIDCGGEKYEMGYRPLLDDSVFGE